jgi:hypothetical protein
MIWRAPPETDVDLVAGRDFIAAENESEARDFLDAVPFISQPARLNPFRPSQNALW